MLILVNSSPQIAAVTTPAAGQVHRRSYITVAIMRVPDHVDATCHPQCHTATHLRFGLLSRLLGCSQIGGCLVRNKSTRQPRHIYSTMSGCRMQIHFVSSLRASTILLMVWGVIF